VNLHGPWGTKSAVVFVRITFDFPRAHSSTHPSPAPHIELDKSPLISPQQRAIMLARLADIRERYRPCFEACLNYLRFGDEKVFPSRAPSPGSESSSDDAASGSRRLKKGRIARVLRNSKNLAEPRTSQGMFSANGKPISLYNRVCLIVNIQGSSSASSVRPLVL
jgi:hypothetical protein